MGLSRFRRSPYLRSHVREFLADFGPTIAIIAMSVVAWFSSGVELPKLDVPLDGIRTSVDRPWFVNPLDAPKWVWLAAIAPAMVVTILVYLDQNITVRLVNSAENRLKKGAGYHLDLTVLALLIGACSLFGLPWMVAATVRSLNHVRSLANFKVDARQQLRIDSVLENRVSALIISLLVGATVFILPVVSLIPMCVLYGLFLFMGIASITSNQFFERLKLWAQEPSRYPPTHYLRTVPTATVHRFTAVQLLCLIVLWIIKSSALKILFPVFIASLVFVRIGMHRYFDRQHLSILDSEEAPEEEEEVYAI